MTWTHFCSLTTERLFRAAARTACFTIEDFVGGGCQSVVVGGSWCGEPGFCLKLARDDSDDPDDDWHGHWGPSWGSRPFDLPILDTGWIWLDAADPAVRRERYHFHYRWLITRRGAPLPYDRWKAQRATYLDRDMVDWDDGPSQWVCLEGQPCLCDYAAFGYLGDLPAALRQALRTAPLDHPLSTASALTSQYPQWRELAARYLLLKGMQTS